MYRRDLPLRGFDEEMRSAMAEAIDARGITQHRHACSTAITKEGTDLVVTLDNGQRLHTDCVFMATGRRPKIDALGLENTAITTADNGRIKVDMNSETAQPGVYAIGDVTDRINLTPVAIAEGHNLADRLFGKGPARQWCYATTPKLFSSPSVSNRRADRGRSRQEWCGGYLFHTLYPHAAHANRPHS